MTIEEQLIELMGEWDHDKWYIIRPTIPMTPPRFAALRRTFITYGGVERTGGLLILADWLDIHDVEYYHIWDTLKMLRINLDILHALYRQIKWRPWTRLKGALQKLGFIV